MAVLGSSLRGLERCPHCGVAQPNLAYVTYVAYPTVKSETKPCWIIYQCSACHDIVAGISDYTATYLQQRAAATLDNGPKTANRIIPSSRTIDGYIPPRARRYLEQALASLSAPDGAIMLAGSAVDAMLKVAGYEDGSVYTRIEKAVFDHVLTPAMSEWAHAVRIESNKPRHADLDEPHATRELAEQSIKFAEALGEYLFALPSRIERGKIASKEAADAAAGSSE